MNTSDTSDVQTIFEMSAYDFCFLNNLYDDDIVVDSVKDFNHQYETDIYAEGVNHKQEVRTGKTREFSVNNELNYKYGIKAGSYSLRIPTNNVAWYSEVEFIDKYGYEVPISSLDILDDMTVFNRSLLLFIGDSFIYEVFYVLTKTEMIAFLQINNHLTKDGIISLLSAETTWSLLYTEKGMTYRTFAPSNKLFDEDKIYVKSLSPREKIASPTTDGRWMLFMSNDPVSYDIMSCTPIPLLTDDAGELYFRISGEFKAFIYQKTRTLKCLLLNDPNCCGSGVWVYSNENAPIFQIPYERTPFSPENIMCWEWDPMSRRKLHPLLSDVALTYPNIYDFRNVEFDNCMYIEWSEAPGIPNITHPPFQDYIEYQGALYPHKVLTGDVPGVINEYAPAPAQPVAEAMYPQSPYFRNYRFWKVYQLVYAMLDNPLRFRKFFNRIYRKLARYITSTYSIEEYPDIYQRSIRNNMEHCDNVATKTTTFLSPHTFIKVNNESGLYRHCALYIDGIRKIPTYNMTYDGYMYVYFPAAWIENGEQIQLDVGLVSDVTKIDDILFQFRFNSSVQKFLNADFSRERSLADLIFYDHTSKDIIDVCDDKHAVRKFDMKLSISIYDIDYKNRDLSDEISFLDTDAELVVPGDGNKELIFASDTFNYFIVKKKTIDHPLNMTGWIKPLHKDIDMSALHLSNPHPSVVGRQLNMASTDFYASYVYDFAGDENFVGLIELWERGDWNAAKTDYDPTPFYVQRNDLFIVNGNTFTLHKFKGAHSKEHFRIFMDGILQNPNTYNIEFPTKYGGDCIITVTFEQRGYMLIDYLPYEEEVIVNEELDHFLTGGDDMIFLQTHLNGAPFDNRLHRVYLDGIRIAPKDIKVVGDGGAIIIRKERYRDKLTSSSNPNLLIARQALDTWMSPLSYNRHQKRSWMLESILLEDRFFREDVIRNFMNE